MLSPAFLKRFGQQILSGEEPVPPEEGVTGNVFRLNITQPSTGSNVNAIGEMELRAVADGPSLAVGGTPSAKSAADSFPASLAFDGDTGTQWRSGSFVASPQWIQYEFPVQVTVSELAIIAGANNAQAPADFTLEVSSDGGSSWMTALSVTGQTGWLQFEERTFALGPLTPVAVNFVGNTTTTYESSTTSQNKAYPGASDPGDLAVAFVMHRSALTLPSGWSLIGTQSVPAGADTHYLTVASRIIATESSSNSFIQAAGGRLCVHIQFFRKSVGSCSILDSAFLANAASPPAVAVPDMLSLADGQIIVGSATSYLAQSGGAPTTVTDNYGPNGILTTPVTVLDNRLAVGYQQVDENTTVSGDFAFTLSSGSTQAVSAAVLIG